MIKQLTSRNMTITSEQQEVDRNPLPNIHFLLYTNSFYSHWSICKYQRKKMYILVEKEKSNREQLSMIPPISTLPFLSLSLPSFFILCNKKNAYSVGYNTHISYPSIHTSGVLTYNLKRKSTFLFTSFLYW
jgi:hypothetical protein